MATHSSILTWKIPWTEEPGSLQSMGMEGDAHTHTHTHTHTLEFEAMEFLKRTGGLERSGIGI